MTTTMLEKVICGVCALSSEHRVLASTNEFGGPDLDLRPPSMMRETMVWWLQQCPSCGFVARDLSQGKPEDVVTMESFEYRNALKDERSLELARRFVARAIFSQRTGDLNEAGLRMLAASWVADDAGRDDLACEWRSKAGVLLESADAGDGNPESLLRRLDIHRRAGEWKKAQNLAMRLAAMELPANLSKIFSFCSGLLESRDRGCYDVHQALGADGSIIPAKNEDNSIAEASQISRGFWGWIRRWAG